MSIGMTMLHALRYAIGKDQAHTQTSQLERDALQRHVAGKRRGVELGVYEGATTVVLARAMKASGGGKLYAIDPFYGGRLGLCWGELIARWEIRRADLGDTVRIVKAISTVAARQLDGVFDFVFVDGDHSLEGFAQDWSDWSGRIAGNGIIALHDTRVPAHNPSVRDLGSLRYFESHIRNDTRFTLVEQIDSLSVLQRA
jgi:predicted O-methyltransferase YrrM